MGELEEMAENIKRYEEMASKLDAYAKEHPKDYAGLVRLEFELAGGHFYEIGSVLVEYHFFGDEDLMSYYIANVQGAISKLFKGR